MFTLPPANSNDAKDNSTSEAHASGCCFVFRPGHGQVSIKSGLQGSTRETRSTSSRSSSSSIKHRTLPSLVGASQASHRWKRGANSTQPLPGTKRRLNFPRLRSTGRGRSSLETLKRSARSQLSCFRSSAEPEKATREQHPIEARPARSRKTAWLVPPANREAKFNGTKCSRHWPQSPASWSVVQSQSPQIQYINL